MRQTTINPPANSADPASSRRAGESRSDAQPDKGRKFEHFYVLPIGSDRRSLALALRLDQKR